MLDVLDDKADVDHTHNEVFKEVVRASNLTNASSSTSMLATTTITLLAGIVYDIDAELVLEGYRDFGTIGIGKVRVTIDGNSAASPVDLSCEQGVDTPKIEFHTRSVTGTDAAIRNYSGRLKAEPRVVVVVLLPDRAELTCAFGTGRFVDLPGLTAKVA